MPENDQSEMVVVRISEDFVTSQHTSANHGCVPLPMHSMAPFNQKDRSAVRHLVDIKVSVTSS